MAEMDIYMRRRLVALGGLVLFFIFFVLVVKSCGGDDDPEAPLTETGATDEGGTAPLSQADFIQQADAICAEANAAVGRIDPTADDATQQELAITREELNQVEALEVERETNDLRQFLRELNNVVTALRSKQAAIQRGDTVAEGEAQLALDTAEAEARELGDSYGFRDCGQFLDAGEAPGGAGGAAGTEPQTTDPTVDPAGTDTTPPADTAPPPDDSGGGAPPPDDSGGITP